MKDISIYIHIPFCQNKCNYCAFNSFCGKNEDVERYLDFLTEELKRRKIDRPVRTIYIGGGTPSILSTQQIERVVSAIYHNYNVYEDAEFTIEANPNSITEEKLLTWKRLRVNRLSVGVQSLKDRSLKKIGRLHTKKEALDKIKLARKYFDNVSADLIVGLERECGKDLCDYARQLLQLGVKHISCYLLEIYKETPIFKMIENKKYHPLSDEDTIASFEKLSNYLKDAGMERYEISNFAYSGYESGHNLNYWRRGEYLGFGLSAHSFLAHRRFKNSDIMKEYEKGVIEEEILTNREIVEEMIMLGLRCREGVDTLKLQELGYDIKANVYYSDYLSQGILKEISQVLFLNPIFYHISNTIISNLLP